MAEMNDPLSERELEILRLVATGAANKEIARQLIISPNTVKVHLRNIFSKIGVSSRTEATLYALKIGLVKSEAAQPDADETNDKISTWGLPGIVMEDGLPAGRSLPAAAGGEAALSGRPRWKIWQMVLVPLLALILIGAGVAAGSRLFTSTPDPAPTTAAQTVETPVITGSSWTQKSSLPAPRKGMGIAEYQNDFYLIAGQTASGIDGAVLRYQPQSDTWKTLASKPTPVSEIQSVLIGEKIYVPGGLLKSGQVTDCLEVYDPRLDAWETKAKLPVPLSAYALASFEGQLYLFGGKDSSKYYAAVYVYDPVEDQWDERTPLSAPRAYASAVTGLGKIFVLGGYDGSHALTLNEAYFPARDLSQEVSWESLAPMPQGRYAMGVAHLAGTIYLAGGLGDDGKPTAPSGLTYQEQTDEWTSLNSAPVPTDAYPAMLASGNFLYILGGETGSKLSAGNHSYQAIYTILVPAINRGKEP